jgi:predicted nucleic acid-binding protein
VICVDTTFLVDLWRNKERLFRVGNVGAETALRCAKIAAHLRAEALPAGRSKPDVRIAARAVQHAASLVTRNTAHFAGIPGLNLIRYQETGGFIHQGRPRPMGNY